MKKNLVKKGVQTVGFVFGCASSVTVLKLMESALVALVAPLTIWVTQNLVDCVIGSQGVMSSQIFRWLFVLLVVMLCSASGNAVDILLNSLLKQRLSRVVTDRIVRKYGKIDYACYEREDTYRVINRMGDKPEEMLLDSFLETANVVVYFISIVGNVIIFSQIGVGFRLCICFV